MPPPGRKRNPDAALDVDSQAVRGSRLGLGEHPPVRRFTARVEVAQ